MMGRYKIFKKWHQDDENEELTSFGEVEDEIGFYVEQASVVFRFSKSNIGTTVNEVKNYLSENNTKIIGVLESKKAKSNFYTRAGQLLGSTLLVETCLVLQDGVGNQIEKVYQKFEVEPETEEATVEE